LTLNHPSDKKKKWGDGGFKKERRKRELVIFETNVLID